MLRSFAVFRRALANPAMRRLQIASAAWTAGEATFMVGLLVAAYASGGPGAVAVIAVIRTLPSVIVAPSMAAFVSRQPLHTSLQLTLAARLALVTALGGAILAGLPAVLIFALAALDSIAATLLRPLRGSALPTLARTPDELVAGNIALLTGDSLAGLTGPIVAAACLAVAGPAAAFVPGILLLGLALGSVVRLRAARPRPSNRPASGKARPKSDRLAAARWLAASPARFVVLALVSQRMIRGALNVLLVVAAVDLLGLGDSGVGLLTAANGLGGLIGGVVAVVLVGRARLAPWFAAGIIVWGLGVGAVGAVAVAGIALVALTIGGVGKVVIDVSSATLLQRIVPSEHRTAIFGLQEGLVAAALTVGAVGASLLLGAIGIANTMIVAGAIPAVVAVVAWVGLRRADAAVVVPERELGLLRGVPFFEPLSLDVLEELAGGIEWRDARAGETIVRQGEIGHEFFIVERGRFAVDSDGRDLGGLGPGGSFGEIALLRDVPRTATVTAIDGGRLATVERARFIDAVTSDRTSETVAERVISERLAN